MIKQKLQTPDNVYRVESNGIIQKYTISTYVNGIPKYTILLLNKFEDGVLVDQTEVPDYVASSTFHVTREMLDSDTWFLDLAEAKSRSEYNYDKYVNPNGIYRVARYFDSIFEAWECGPRSKPEAYEYLRSINSRTAGKRYYVSYRVVDVTSSINDQT